MTTVESFTWGISQLSFSGGESISLDPGSILILIGPNNSGKTQALKDIESFLTRSGQRLAVTEFAMFRTGSAASFADWLDAHYPRRTRQGVPYYQTQGGNLQASTVDQVWGSGPPYLQAAAPFLVRRLATENRLTVTNPVASINLYNKPPQAYIHVLQTNEHVHRSARDLVRAAFGVDLLINWVGGETVWFHVGEEPQIDADRVSSPYNEALSQLPPLQNEGDGIRAFVGTLLAALCGAHRILLIDEPEAFLHPPQANRLAGALASSTQQSGAQLIVATHSADVVRGALEASTNVSVCRITRDDSENHASLLNSTELRELWSRPILRSAAAIDGLFHDGVIVCESDADCRIYELLLRRLEKRGGLSRPADVHFTHGGGKGQLPVLAGAYCRLNTRTAVIADLDLLRERDLTRATVTALHGEFDQHQSLYNSVCAAMAQRPPLASAADLQKKVTAIAKNYQSSAQPLTTQDRRDLLNLLDDSSDWSEVKKYGIRKLSGGTSRAAKELLEAFRSVGMFLVPEGELERWWRDGPADKAEWVVAAQRKIEEDDSSFSEAEEFVAAICRFFNYIHP